MKYLRWLLFPFSLIYALIVIIRNWFYDAGLFKSSLFSIPIISVGNLEVGGAGKSPMTEYLIRLLKNDYKLATLSRGYGRQTKGFVLADLETGGSLSSQIGDEPSQFKHKFPDVAIAVCEQRVVGIRQLMQNHNLILMDDAYQHRAVEPGLSILLFDYTSINKPHIVLPAGNYREPFSGRWRAQIIIISKCPLTLTDAEKNVLAQKIKPLPYQQLFFTAIAYQPLQDLKDRPVEIHIDQQTTVFLLTGIANPKPLLLHLGKQTPHIIHHNYPDHHSFTLKNITKLAAEYAAHPSQKKIIITTEKDAQRLEESWFKSALPAHEQLPVFVIPISVEFLNNSGQQFNQLITDYVREHTKNNSIH
ncbi:tetraacyldisaccharide 4'-kinase [Mucilaginibacter sp.]|uniref:tetraacyldisaccharide 4'-kinase n=1 Tax=Mucilaginibacter sp. TaxID=1882438 RepID=UPI003D0A16F2